MSDLPDRGAGDELAYSDHLDAVLGVELSHEEEFAQARCDHPLEDREHTESGVVVCSCGAWLGSHP